MAKSYYASYESNDKSKCLIGGVYSSRSSRFGLKRDAERYLAHVIGLNGPHCVGKIVPSYQPPEIFPHCPKAPAQSVGCLCFSCRQMITQADADNWTPPTEDA